VDDAVRAALALALLAAALALPARAAPVVLRDDRGVEQRFDAPPKRIVTLLPSVTEMVAALGGTSRLVGIDRHADWPPEVRSLPRLGSLDDAQIEAIVALRPDVVIASTAGRTLDRLETLGVRVLRLKSDSHADVQRTVRLLAALLGTPAEGERLWAGIERQIEAAAQRVPPALRGRTVYFEIGGGPYAAGTSSFIGETLARLGLRNIVPAALGPFPKLNPEFVVQAAPEIAMGPRREQAGLAARPGFGHLPAVREQRLCGFDAHEYDMLVRPGPRLGEAAGLLADCLVRLEAR
jgi:iron complex transport system substrate-binding protein